jgi:hypothetical protein
MAFSDVYHLIIQQLVDYLIEFICLACFDACRQADQVDDNPGISPGDIFRLYLAILEGKVTVFSIVPKFPGCHFYLFSIGG